VRLVANAEVAASVVLGAARLAQLPAAVAPACHQWLLQIQAGAAQLWLSQVPTQSLSILGPQQHFSEGLLLDGVNSGTCSSSDAAQVLLLLLLLWCMPAMTLGLLVASQVPLGDLCCHGLGQGGVPYAQRHQEADSLRKFGIWQVSEIDIALTKLTAWLAVVLGPT